MTEPSQPSSLLVTQWAVCGIAAAAARFVPVPMLDDVVRAQAVRVAVSRTLRAHGRDYPAGLLEPLWDDPEGRGAGMGRRLKSLSLRVLLFPVRKYAAVFGAVRGVPNDVMRVLLLARTVDRRLTGGELAGPDPDRLHEHARHVRAAVDEAIDGVDLRLLTAALADGLSQGRGLTAAAVAYARRWSTRPDSEPVLEPEGAVAEGAQRVTEVLRRPEIARLLEDFDAQVDATLAATP
jgi:hypothetical protein